MLALGKSSESEYLENLCKVSGKLVGEVGILFTSKSKEEIVEYEFIYFVCDINRYLKYLFF